MRCPRRWKHRISKIFAKGGGPTWLCQGHVLKPTRKGDIICCCVKSLDHCGKPHFVIEVKMRPDEALEIGTGLIDAVNLWLVDEPAYEGIHTNKSNILRRTK